MDGSLNGETWRFIVRNIRIGVVEDDPASCQLVLDYLNRYQSETGEQFTVSVFDDGARIVEKYAPVYDILLLDIEMKEMDGMAAARRIRERDDNVVIIFITAAPQYAISGYEVRALSYLLKPLPWFAFSQELKKSIDMVRRNGDDSMLIETGKAAQTEYEVLEYAEDNTARVRLKPITGRSHQLRVHMLALGHPILGDRFYATPEALAMAPRLLLHAETLTITHPAYGNAMTFRAPLDF